MTPTTAAVSPSRSERNEHAATNTLTPSADTRQHAQRTSPFRRGLGEYPLRSRRPSALLTMRARHDKPALGRVTGCAFAISNVSTDPLSPKQAMAEERVGWGAAERAKIANHANNGNWTTIDRSKVPSGRSLVRPIWVYKCKRGGALKARLYVQSCARVYGVDYDQTFWPRCDTRRYYRLQPLPTLPACACADGISSLPTFKET
eukprot:2206284-Pleurochrysis_carterae.AAC.4